MRAQRLRGDTRWVWWLHSLTYRNKAALRCTITSLCLSRQRGISRSLRGSLLSQNLCLWGLRCAVLTTEEEWECSTLVDFFTESALLSLLEVLAALGELRPLERMSSLIGEALPSGLAGCFLRPLRSVDIYWFDRKESLLKPAFGQTLHLGISFCLVHGWITPAKSLRNGKPRALNTGTAFPWKLIWA